MTKYWSKSVLHLQEQLQGRHQPVSKTVMMALHHVCASRFWNILGEVGCKTALCNLDLSAHSCSLWVLCWFWFNPGAMPSLFICAFTGVSLATACERAVGQHVHYLYPLGFWLSPFFSLCCRKSIARLQ